MKWIISLFLLCMNALQAEPTPDQIVGLRHTSPKNTTIFLEELTGGITAPDFTAVDFNAIAKLPDGEHTAHWDNGQIKYRLTLKNHILEGHFHGWYQDGADAFKGYVENGVPLGIHMAFYPSEKRDGYSRKGRLFSYNEKGNLDGEQFQWFNEGSLKALVTYQDGVPDGLCLLNSAPNKRIVEHTYKRGKVVNEKTTTP